MIVPHEQLNLQTLMALIEEFVTRDGALHGHADTPIERRVASVLELLKAGRAVVVFDPDSETASIVMTDTQPARKANAPAVDETD